MRRSTFTSEGRSRVTVADWLVIAGGAMQVAGVIITFVGAVRTWNEFSDERLFDGTLEGLRSVAHTVHVRLRALVGRPMAVRASGRIIGPAVEVSGSGRVSVSYSPLSNESDLNDSVNVLDERTRALRADLSRLSDRLTHEISPLDRRLTSIENELTVSLSRLEEQDRRVATGGIKAVLGGLALVGIGIATQTMTVLVG